MLRYSQFNLDTQSLQQDQDPSETPALEGVYLDILVRNLNHHSCMGRVRRQRLVVKSIIRFSMCHGYVVDQLADCTDIANPTTVLLA